jgi:U2 small nuclear ribonucleoprotein A'
MGVKSRTFDIPTANGTSTSSSKNYRVKLTEKELNEGRVPVGAQGADDAMEE